MEKQTKICPHCGGEVLAVAKKCKHCHNWLTDGQTAEDTPIKTNDELWQDDDDSNKTIWMVIAAVVFIAIIITFVLFNENSQSSNEFFDEAEWSPSESRY